MVSWLGDAVFSLLLLGDVVSNCEGDGCSSCSVGGKEVAGLLDGLIVEVGLLSTSNQISLVQVLVESSDGLPDDGSSSESDKPSSGGLSDVDS